MARKAESIKPREEKEPLDLNEGVNGANNVETEPEEDATTLTPKQEKVIQRACELDTLADLCLKEIDTHINVS